MRMFFVLCTEKLSVLLVIHSNLTHNQIPKSRTTIVLVVVAKLLVTIKTLPKPQASSPRESGSFFFGRTQVNCDVWLNWRSRLAVPLAVDGPTTIDLISISSPSFVAKFIFYYVLTDDIFGKCPAWDGWNIFRILSCHHSSERHSSKNTSISRRFAQYI